MIPFNVSITTPNQIETINILAANSCAATVQVIKMMFGDCFEADKPRSIRIKVEPARKAAPRCWSCEFAGPEMYDPFGTGINPIMRACTANACPWGKR